MLKKGKLIFLFSLIIAVFIFFIFSKSFADDKPKVVVVLKSLDSQYWEIIKAGAETAFSDFDIDGKVLAPEDGSSEGQSKLLKRIFNENPDALIVSPTDSNVIPILEMFINVKEVPVLLVDSDLMWENKTSYVGTDNLDLGKKAGSFLASELFPGNKVAIIGGDLSNSAFGERILGAKMTLEDAGLILAEETVGLSNDENDVKLEMRKILMEHPDIKGVVTTHDLIALPVIEVLEEKGLTLPVTGADGIIDLLKFIEKGAISGTVAQNPFDMGYLSVENALKAIKGKNVEKVVDTGVDIIIKGNTRDRLDFYNKLFK